MDNSFSFLVYLLLKWNSHLIYWHDASQVTQFEIALRQAESLAFQVMLAGLNVHADADGEDANDDEVW